MKVRCALSVLKKEREVSLMFKNPGKAVKITAIILFILLAVTAIILAIYFGFELNKSRWREFEPKIFYGYGIGGCAGAFVLMLPLYAFGALVEDVHSIKEGKK